MEVARIFRGISSMYIMFILLTSSFIVFFIFDSATDEGTVEASVIYVDAGGGGGHYTTIQKAIDNASSGDTIYVWAGNYYENVIVNKTLTLIGSGIQNTTIDGGGGNGYAIYICADWVNITGFSVNGSLNPQSGIAFSGANNCNISNNNILNSYNGIGLGNSCNNIIKNNICSSFHLGLCLGNSNNNSFINNTCASNPAYGVYLSHSNDNLFDNNNLSSTYGNSIHILAAKNNTFFNNTMSNNGIYIEGTSIEHYNSHTIDSSNTINGKPVYYYKNQNGKKVPNDAGQVILANCTNFILENQNVSYDIGLFLAYSSNNVIANNTGLSNYRGIYLKDSHNNILINNTISTGGKYQYECGISLYQSSNNNLMANIINILGKYGYGIILTSASNNKITSNKIITSEDYDYGISIEYSKNNNLINNNIIITGKSSHGIYIKQFSKQNNVKNNLINMTGSGSYGIYLDDSSNNNNIISNIIDAPYGIYLITSFKNEIINNTLSTSEGGIYLGYYSYKNNLTDNIIELINPGGTGIVFSEASNNNLKNNKINVLSWLGYGIWFSYSSNNKLVSNSILNPGQKGYGIYLYQSSNNTFLDNNINTSGQSGYGIYLFNSSNNNSLIGNTIHTFGMYGHGIIADGSNNTSIFNCNVTTTGLISHGFCLKSQFAFVINTAISTANSNYDIIIIEDGNITAINCTFNTVQLTKNGGGILQVKNYLGIQVYDDDYITSIQGADVEVRDNNVKIYASSGYGGNDSSTDSNGRVENILVMDRYYYYNNTATNNITSIKVKNIKGQKWEEVREDIDMNTSHIEIFYFDIAQPLIPTGLKVTRIYNTNTLNISWDLNLDTVNYAVYSNKSGNWEILCNITHPKNWTLTEDLEDNTWYYYRIQAWDKASLSSNFSSVAAFYLTDITSPVIPSGLKAEPVPGGDAINITWEVNPDDVDHYHIYYKDPNTVGWRFLDMVKHPLNRYTWSNDSNLVNGTTYNFKLRAGYEHIAPSDFTEPVSVVHRDYLAPTAPKDLKAEAISEYIINLSWSDSPEVDVHGYKVYMNRTGGDSEGPFIYLGIVNKSTFDVKGLMENTAYYFVVKAFDEANNTSPNSMVVKCKTKRWIERPRVTSITPESGSTDIPINITIMITFSLPMDTKSVESRLIITPETFYELIWMDDQTILMIDFSENLSYSTEYSIVFGAISATNGGVLLVWPYELKFTTESTPKPQPKIEITSPKENSEYEVGSIILVTGTSAYIAANTKVNVNIANKRADGKIEFDSSWRVEILAPIEPGHYTINVTANGQVDSVLIIVTPIDSDGDEVNVTADYDEKDDGIFGMSTTTFFVISLGVLVLVIAILFLILLKKEQILAWVKGKSEDGFGKYDDEKIEDKK